MFDFRLRNNSPTDSAPGHNPGETSDWLWLKLRVGSVLEFLWDLLPRRWAPSVYRMISQAASYLRDPLRAKVRRFAAHLMARRADVERDYQAWIHLYERSDVVARRTGHGAYRPL